MATFHRNLRPVKGECNKNKWRYDASGTATSAIRIRHLESSAVFAIRDSHQASPSQANETKSEPSEFLNILVLHPQPILFRR